MPNDPTKPPGTPTQDPMVSIEEFEEMARKRYGIPEKLWKAIPAQESGGNWNATSPTGVRGKYQVTQGTARRLGLNRDDPYEQVAAAAKLLRQEYDALEGVYQDENDRWYGAAARYYGGPKAVRPDGSLSRASQDQLSNPARYVEQLSQKIAQMDENQAIMAENRQIGARNTAIDLERNKLEAEDYYSRADQAARTKGYNSPATIATLRRKGDEALLRSNAAMKALQQDYGDLAEAGATTGTAQDPRQWPYVKLASGEQLLKPAPPQPQRQQAPRLNRTWGEAAQDFALGVAAGAADIPAYTVGLVAPSVGQSLAKSGEFWRNMQSAALQQRQQEANDIITKAQQEDGFWSAVGTAITTYATDPALAADFIASNLASSIPGLGLGKGAQALAKARMLARGLAAVETTNKAAKVGALTATLTNAVMNAGGARADAYQTLQQDYIAQGMSPEQAAQRAAWGSIGPAVVGGITGAISGGTGLESRLFSKAKIAEKVTGKIGQALANAGEDMAGKAPGLLSRAGKGLKEGAVELAGELVEEVPAQIATNIASPTRGVLQDVPQTIGQTLIGSAPFGAATAGLAMRTPKEKPGATPPPTVATPTGTAVPDTWQSLFKGRELDDDLEIYAKALDDLDVAFTSGDLDVIDQATTTAQSFRDKLTGAADPQSPRLTQLKAALSQLTDATQVASLQEVIDEETARLKGQMPGALEPDEFHIERRDFAAQYGLDPSQPLAAQVAAKRTGTTTAAPAAPTATPATPAAATGTGATTTTTTAPAAATTTPPAAAAPNVPPGGRVVTFKGQDVVLDEEQSKAWDLANETYALAQGSYDRAVLSGDPVKVEEAKRKLHGAGQARAAARRRITGLLTDKEKAALPKFAIGAKVWVNGQEGTVQGAVFGKWRVQLAEDGQVVSATEEELSTTPPGTTTTTTAPPVPPAPSTDVSTAPGVTPAPPAPSQPQATATEPTGPTIRRPGPWSTQRIEDNPLTTFGAVRDKKGKIIGYRPNSLSIVFTAGQEVLIYDRAQGLPDSPEFPDNKTGRIIRAASRPLLGRMYLVRTNAGAETWVAGSNLLLIEPPPEAAQPAAPATEEAPPSRPQAPPSAPPPPPAPPAAAAPEPTTPPPPPAPPVAPSAPTPSAPSAPAPSAPEAPTSAAPQGQRDVFEQMAEFDAIWDELMTEARAAEEGTSRPSGAPSRPTTSTGPAATSPTATGEAATRSSTDLQDAVNKAVRASLDAVRAVMQEATPKPGSLSMGGLGVPVNFDRNSYLRLKPYFAEVFKAYSDVGTALKDVLRAYFRDFLQSGGTAAELDFTRPLVSFYYQSEQLFRNWRELRTTQTDPRAVAIRRAINVERRRMERDQVDKGVRGWLTHATFKTEPLTEGEDPASRPPALGEHPQLRRALDLDPMPPYRAVVNGKERTNPAWQEAIKDAANAMAEALFGNTRLSESEPWRVNEAWDNLVQLVEEIGETVEPTLQQAWDRTNRAYINHKESRARFLNHPTTQQLLKDLYDAAENPLTTPGELAKRLSRATEPLIQTGIDSGLAKNWVQTWIKESVRPQLDKLVEQAKSRSTGVSPESDTGRGGDTDEDGTGVTPPPPTPPVLPPNAVRQASAEDQAMFKDISTTARKTGGRQMIEDKYGDKGKVALKIYDHIDSMLAEADERQTIVKECL